MRQKWNNHKCYCGSRISHTLQRRMFEWKELSNWELMAFSCRVAFPTQKWNRFARRTIFTISNLHFKSKTLLTFFSFHLQPAIATDMPDDVDSIWSCTSCRAVFRAEFVWIVDTIQADDTAITARRDSPEIRPNRSPTKRHANVSSRSRFLLKNV